MSAVLHPMTLAEFLAWERVQPGKFEFDGIQPVAMTGGSVQHSRIGARLIMALGARVKPPCEVFQSDLKVLTAFASRARYPDATIACGVGDATGDLIEPVVVFEVTSPSTALLDRRVNALEYQQTPSVLAYVVLEADEPTGTVMRRATGWAIEAVGTTLGLPEVGVALPLAEIYRRS